MPNTSTPNISLLKPDPNDIIDVNIINGNMDKIDNWIGTANVITTVPDPAAFAGAYYLGVSMFRLTGSDIGTFPAWAVDPGSAAAVVVTFKPNADRAVQFWFRGSAAVQASYYRYLTTTVNYPWTKIGGPDYAGYSSNTSVAVANNTWTKFNVSSNQDMIAGVDIVAALGGLTLKSGGTYQVEGLIAWGGLASGVRYIGIDVDGAGPTSLNRASQEINTNASCFQAVSMTRAFPANSTIYLWGLHSSGAGMTIDNRRLFARRVNA